MQKNPTFYEGCTEIIEKFTRTSLDKKDKSLELQQLITQVTFYERDI